MKVLFVCTGNTCRSPMAEALFNDICNKKGIEAEASSAGIFADGTPVSQNAVLVMRKMGIDISGKLSTSITVCDTDKFDLILTMTSSHKEILKTMLNVGEKVYTLGEYAGADTDVPDPFGGDEVVYERCRDIIADMIEKVAERI